MNLKALLSIDTKYIDDIRKLLMDEKIEVFALTEKENILDELVKGYLDILFLGYSITFNNEDVAHTIKKIKKLDPRLEIICLGSKEDESRAIEVIKCGASAFLGTPPDHGQIREVMNKIKDHALDRREIYQIETALHEKYIFADMVSKTPVMLDIFNLIKRVAQYYRTMLILGDTGTGKEVMAKAVHKLSPVSSEPFIVCNCSGLVENLIESELFGYVKGAFTGAVSDKKGLFEVAGNGTIFLDEIGDMPLSFQPHLLRVLQDGEFRPVGSTETKKAGCRVIAATNADLQEKVKTGKFREDLFFRLAVITIEVPSLRERKEDIPLLCRFFLNKLNNKIGKEIRGITMDAKRIIMAYDWPGNIRELENIIERAVLVTTVNFIRSQDLPVLVLDTGNKDSGSVLSLEELEKNHIRHILNKTGGNKSKSASLLGISRKALFRRIIKYGLG